MLTSDARLEGMNRLGRAMVDPARSRMLLTLPNGPEYPAVPAQDSELTRSNVSNHLACLRDCGIVIALHQDAACIDPVYTVGAGNRGTEVRA